MSEFLWHIQHWPTVAGFVEHLSALPAPAWIAGITVHHTVSPTIPQWRGTASMLALRDYYRDTQKWPAGPHLFVAPDGIWQGTPIIVQGVHAGPCNASRLGMEVVGNYDLGPWLEPIRSLAFGALTALCHWLKKDEQCINGHRDCMQGRSCPGKYVQLPDIRTQVGFLLRPSVPQGFYAVDPFLQRIYDQSGGLWRESLYAPGYAVTPLFYYPDDACSYQLFERGGVRVKNQTTVEWLRTDEVEALKTWYRHHEERAE